MQLRVFVPLFLLLRIASAQSATRNCEFDDKLVRKLYCCTHTLTHPCRPSGVLPVASLAPVILFLINQINDRSLFSFRLCSGGGQEGRVRTGEEGSGRGYSRSNGKISPSIVRISLNERGRQH